MSSPLPEVGKSTGGPPGTADAVLASDNDKPAAPEAERILRDRERVPERRLAQLGGAAGVVVNGNMVFAAGVTSGIDGALYVAAKLRGDAANSITA